MTRRASCVVDDDPRSVADGAPAMLRDESGDRLRVDLEGARFRASRVVDGEPADPGRGRA